MNHYIRTCNYNNLNLSTVDGDNIIKIPFLSANNDDENLFVCHKQINYIQTRQHLNNKNRKRQT